MRRRRASRIAQTQPTHLLRSNHHVTAERAYLYGTPKEDGKKMEYLISGDAVVVLDEVGDWSQIRYRQAKGNEIVRWVRSADLAGGS